MKVRSLQFSYWCIDPTYTEIQHVYERRLVLIIRGNHRLKVTSATMSALKKVLCVAQVKAEITPHLILPLSEN